MIGRLCVYKRVVGNVSVTSFPLSLICRENKRRVHIMETDVTSDFIALYQAQKLDQIYGPSRGPEWMDCSQLGSGRFNQTCEKTSLFANNDRVAVFGYAAMDP